MNNFKLIKTDLERINENKKMFIIINIIFFVLLFIANYMTPLMGDDLVYMNVLDSNVPTKISSFKDALHNTIFLYRIWSGRILPNLFNFTFFIFNKNVFNFFNSLIYVILSLVIYIYIYIYIYGRKTKINNSYLLLIYSLIWFYLPDKVDVYLWQTGSLNYFSNVLLCLLWLIPYYTYSICNKKNKLYSKVFV